MTKRQRRSIEMKKLIVNADDFGFDEAVNYGILKGYQEGIVTSTSIMANMPGFEHAVALAKQHPNLGIGVHMTLTCYYPLGKGYKTLTREDGSFKKQGDINEFDEEEAYQELKLQIDRVLASGIPVDHLDSHHHIHTFPHLKHVVERLQKEYGLPIRGGFQYETAMPHVELLDQFYAEGATIENFKALLHTLDTTKIYDLMCHPAYLDKFLQQTTSYNIQRIDELYILCNKEVKAYIKEANVELLRYSNL